MATKKSFENATIRTTSLRFGRAAQELRAVNLIEELTRHGANIGDGFEQQ
jgi:hypothetical protein